jgi:hypothetical protein
MSAGVARVDPRDRLFVAGKPASGSAAAGQLETLRFPDSLPYSRHSIRYHVNAGKRQGPSLSIGIVGAV